VTLGLRSSVYTCLLACAVHIAGQFYAILHQGSPKSVQSGANVTIDAEYVACSHPCVCSHGHMCMHGSLTAYRQ
jgi:hypothetical protein